MIAVQYRYSERVPSLNEVLNNKYETAWSLPAFKEFLERSSCSEGLDFILDVATYREIFNSRTSHSFSSNSNDNARAIYSMWQHILEFYVIPDARQEINIPGWVRSDLLLHKDSSDPPTPDELQDAYDMMLDLLDDPFSRFVESIRNNEHSIYTVRTMNSGRSSVSLESQMSGANDEDTTKLTGEKPLYQRAYKIFGSKLPIKGRQKTI